MFKRTVLAAALLLAIVTVPTSPATAGPNAQHCVNRVIGTRANGELILSANHCYSSFDGAMKAEHVTAWGIGASAAAARSGIAAATFTLAVHYDLANLNPAGGTISTVGTGCTGGYANMSPAWNNRISSTANGCSFVTHYDLINKGGDSFTTTGAGGNVGALSNRVGSVSYS